VHSLSRYLMKCNRNMKISLLASFTASTSLITASTTKCVKLANAIVLHGEIRLSVDYPTSFSVVENNEIQFLQSKQFFRSNVTEITIDLPLPFAWTRYNISVEIKSGSEGAQWWSEPSSLLVKSASEVPRTSPVLPPSGYEEVILDIIENNIV